MTQFTSFQQIIHDFYQQYQYRHRTSFSIFDYSNSEEKQKKLHSVANLAIVNGRLDIIKLLMEEGLDASQEIVDFPLVLNAINHQKFDILRYFHEKHIPMFFQKTYEMRGTNIGQFRKNESFNCALSFAIFKHSYTSTLHIISYLIEQPDLLFYYRQSTYKNNILMAIARSNHSFLLSLFEKNGLDLSLEESAPLVMACACRNQEAIQFFSQQPLSEHIKHTVLSYCNKHSYKDLLDYFVSIGFADNLVKESLKDYHLFSPEIKNFLEHIMAKRQLFLNLEDDLEEKKHASTIKL